MKALPTANIFQNLQKEILALQGLGNMSAMQGIDTGLPFIEKAFPDQIFPVSGVHEFISSAQEHAAATSGFISGLLKAFMHSNGYCLWISTRRTIFPPALKVLGIPPERIIFIDLIRGKETLWAIEEALKCDALAAVVGELSEMNFTESRRLQLAVEQSKVTGFIHRYRPGNENTIAAVTRWKISPLPSIVEDGLPGVGHPRWNVRLLKVRNGRPGTWQVAWMPEGFRIIPAFTISTTQRVALKTG